MGEGLECYIMSNLKSKQIEKYFTLFKCRDNWNREYFFVRGRKHRCNKDEILRMLLKIVCVYNFSWINYTPLQIIKFTSKDSTIKSFRKRRRRQLLDLDKRWDNYVIREALGGNERDRLSTARAHVAERHWLQLLPLYKTHTDRQHYPIPFPKEVLVTSSPVSLPTATKPVSRR